MASFYSAGSEQSVRNTVKSTTGNKTRNTFKTLHEGILTLKTGFLSSKKIFCVLLQNDPHLYAIEFAQLNDENPNFVNPYLNALESAETVHESFYQSFREFKDDD